MDVTWIHGEDARLNSSINRDIVMPSRREFLQLGFAASVLPVTIPDVAAPIAGRPSNAMTRLTYPLYAVIADVRFRASVECGGDAERRGVRVVRIAGDISEFWFSDLSLRWRTEPAAIAGLTAHGPLFCLERLAWDHGMRVVYRETQSQHDELGEALVFWVIGSR